MSTVKKIVRGASTRIVTYPVRVLIIINSVIFPILLGVIIFLIMKFTKPVMDVITKAKSIEKLVEDNIHLGISKVKELYNQKDKIVEYAKDSLVHMLELYVPNIPKNLTQLENIINTSFNYISHKAEDSIFKFIEDNNSIDNILQKIINEINKLDNIPEKEKEKIIYALNQIISHHYSIIELFTHHELLK